MLAQLVPVRSVTMHLFFQCIHSEDMWRRLGLSEIIQDVVLVDRSSSVVMEHILMLPDNPLQLMPLLDVKHVIVTAKWYLWWTRRRITHNETCPPAVRRPLSVLAIASNYHRAFAKKKDEHVPRWTRPDPKFVKLKVDAAYFEEEGMGATSVVVRDEKGTFLAVQCKFITHAADVMTMEAMAMRDGLNLVSTLGFQRVEAESEYLNVINFCNRQNRWWDAAAAVFVECVAIGVLIGKVNFKHCYRSTNQVEHVLANFSFGNKTFSFGVDEPPYCLVTKLVDDVYLFYN